MYDIFLIFFYKNNKFIMHSFKYPEQVTGWFCLFGLKLLWGLTFGFKLKVFCLIVLWPFFVSLQLGLFGTLIVRAIDFHNQIMTKNHFL